MWAIAFRARAVCRPGSIPTSSAMSAATTNGRATGNSPDASACKSFDGVQLLNRTPIQPLTQPIVRFDLDRMDDNDNRLFGVTAQVQWIPKPAYQLTLRT